VNFTFDLLATKTMAGAVYAWVACVSSLAALDAKNASYLLETKSDDAHTNRWTDNEQCPGIILATTRATHFSSCSFALSANILHFATSPV